MNSKQFPIAESLTTNLEKFITKIEFPRKSEFYRITKENIGVAMMKLKPLVKKYRSNKTYIGNTFLI